MIYMREDLNSNISEEFNDFDETAKAWLAASPGKTYADFYAHSKVGKIAPGDEHATLGYNLCVLSEGGDLRTFREHGRKSAQNAIRQFSLKPHHTLVDYGCGTLRLGVLFMEYFEPGNYCGLDICDEYFPIARELVGPDLFQEKKPC